MVEIKIKTYLNFIFILSFIAVISALFIEYILGYQPCNLCLLERIPYGLSMILITLSYIIKKDQKFLILLLNIVFFFSLSISIYHLGIEQSFWEESSVCGLQNSTDLILKEDILKQLSDKNISCKDVTFRIFGLSLTSINIAINLIIITILVKLFKKYNEAK
tara:strand:+ start:640 stop:1125 length:486 start_codon:yes stop_codon:yes gene_type:complete